MEFESAVFYRLIANRFLKMCCLGVIACLVGFLINGLTESSLYYSRVSLIFWYLVGMLFGLQRITHEEQVKHD